MNNRKVQDIITKKLLEEATSEELRFLDDWRKESDQNEALYQEYATIWNATANYPSIDFQPNVEAAYQKHLQLLSEEKEETKVVELKEIESSEDLEYKPTFKLFTLRRMASIAAMMVVAIGALF